MLKTIPFAAAFLLAGALALPPTAEADHGSGASLRVGSHFRVGGVDVSLVYGSFGPRYPASYFYRVPRPVAQQRLYCTSCYVQGGYQYHPVSCPIIGAHFRAHSFHPDRFWGYAGHPPPRPRPRPVYRTAPPPAYYVWVPPAPRPPHHVRKSHRYHPVHGWDGPPGHRKKQKGKHKGHPRHRYR